MCEQQFPSLQTAPHAADLSAKTPCIIQRLHFSAQRFVPANLVYGFFSFPHIATVLLLPPCAHHELVEFLFLPLQDTEFCSPPVRFIGVAEAFQIAAGFVERLVG